MKFKKVMKLYHDYIDSLICFKVYINLGYYLAK